MSRPPPIPVTLTWTEITVAAQAGVMRRVRSLSEGRRDRRGKPKKNPWVMDIEGCIGEMALASALGKYWVPESRDPQLVDLGTDIQVKATTVLQGHLIVPPDCVDHHRYVLVTIEYRTKWDEAARQEVGVPPLCLVVGWIRAADAQRKEWWKKLDPDRPEAWMVPQDGGLKPMAEFT